MFLNELDAVAEYMTGGDGMNRAAAMNITCMGYRAQDMLLEVQFRQDGRRYCYHEVPEELWYRMKQADSIDTFFNTFILNHFE